MEKNKNVPEAYREGLNKTLKVFTHTMMAIEEENGELSEFFVIGFFSTFLVEGLRKFCKAFDLPDEEKLRMFNVIQDIIEKHKRN